MPTPNIHDQVRYTDAAMLQAFNDSEQSSPFRGLVLKKREPNGMAQFSVLFAPAIFQKITSELTPAGLDAKKLSIVTDLYKAGYEVSRKILDNAKGWVGDAEMMRTLTQMGRDAQFAVDAALSALLEANANDILGSPFFGAAVALPNSAQTVTNTLAGTGSTAAQIKADFYSTITQFVNHKNVGGRPYHGTAWLNKKPILMYPTALQAAMEAAFEAQNDAAGASNTAFKRVELRPNPYLADANDWFLVNPAPRYMPFCHLDEYDPRLQTNAKDGMADRDVIIRNNILFATEYPFGVSFGSRMEIIRVTNV